MDAGQLIALGGTVLAVSGVTGFILNRTRPVRPPLAEQAKEEADAVFPAEGPDTGFVLISGAHAFPARQGHVIRSSCVPELAHLAGDFSGIVDDHPDLAGAAALRNLGHRPWTLLPPTGLSRRIVPGQSARLEAGSRILDGDLVFIVSRPE